MKPARKTSAFTLIELLIVVAIIAILAAIAVPNFLEAQTRAKVSRAKADMRSLATAFESYYVDNNHYPLGIIVDLPDPNSWNWGFIPNSVTTPVAYMTSLADDVFGVFYLSGSSGNVQAGHPKGHPHSRYRTIRSEWYPGNVFIPAEAPWKSFYEDVIVGPWGPASSPYMIISPGPDLSEEIIPNYNVTYYDPTNGTVSRGDLGYFGGGGILR